MTEQTPYIDFENLPAPSEGFLVTQFLTVRSVARSRAFYSEVLGGQVVLEENPCMVKLANSWLIMNPGGGPTPDKPDISVVDYEFDNTLSAFMNLRVADIQACYEEWKSKRGRVRDAADRSRCRDSLLHAGSRRLPDRGRPIDGTAQGQTRQEAARGSARLGGR